ncbi:hypothetical protein AOXY_G23664 [Acipenser oxyrinchus oxyrinchus]|uniref:Uncharacterized protein n=1 Tax=Acipenser oxyrinchus oxyrinchus TaxID=40147 RepID=A0AAD8CX46_ACIOX|nr:hypothetical protein AOXY_G23664 [Acipenser oxyrinchus oxyrinchus]
MKTWRWGDYKITILIPAGHVIAMVPADPAHRGRLQITFYSPKGVGALLRSPSPKIASVLYEPGVYGLRPRKHKKGLEPLIHPNQRAMAMSEHL